MEKSFKIGIISLDRVKEGCLAKKQKKTDTSLPIKLLGSKIKSERKFQGLTQTVLAQLSGVGINFVSQIEAGKERAHIGKILKVMSTLGLQFKVESGEEGIKVD